MSAIGKKLLISLLMIAFFLAAVSTQTTKAGPSITVEIVPSTDNILPEQQFYVNVTISDIEASHDLVGIEFQIQWNLTLLTGISMELPSGHIFQAAEDDDNRWVLRKTVNDTAMGYTDTAWYQVTVSDLAAGYDAGYLPLTGSGVVCKITFNATDVLGNSTIQFEWHENYPDPGVAIKLSDGYGEKITDFTTIDSEIDVVPEFSSSFLYAIFLAFSLIVVVIYKKFPKNRCRL